MPSTPASRAATWISGHGTWRTRSSSRSPTRAAASCPASAARSSIPSSPPNRSARAWGSGWRSATASSKRTAAPSTSSRVRARARSSECGCRSGPRCRRRRLVSAGGGMVTARRPSILVIDDEAHVVESVQELLRLEYRVLGATQASDAIGILGEQPVDVVMTDQRMPGMTGVELLHHVRETHPDAIRLLFTGYADIRAVIDAINRGNVYRYITKPWDPDELHTIIRDAAERHDLIVERQQLLAQLERANEDLRRANGELAEASALKSNFIQVASHELRTPLAILLPLTYMAERAPGVGEPLQGWMRAMARATDRLRYLVDQLITMLS